MIIDNDISKLFRPFFSFIQFEKFDRTTLYITNLFKSFLHYLQCQNIITLTAEFRILLLGPAGARKRLGWKITTMERAHRVGDPCRLSCRVRKDGLELEKKSKHPPQIFKKKIKNKRGGGKCLCSNSKTRDFPTLAYEVMLSYDKYVVLILCVCVHVFKFMVLGEYLC